MTTYIETTAPKVARVPESEATYRLVRPLELDEAARVTSEMREKNFRTREMTPVPASMTLGAAAVLGSIMYLAAAYGFWFLNSPALLQLALAGTSLYATRRVFTLMVSRTRAGAYFNGGDNSRNITGTDIVVTMSLLLLASTHLGLSPMTQALATAGAIAVLGMLQKASIWLLSSRLKQNEAARVQEELQPSVA